MITLAWYVLKVIICSGILFGYYYIALRNKIFHRWNRFYLLASVILALAVPLMKINIFQPASTDKGTVVKMLQTISSGDDIIIEYSKSGGFHFSYENIIWLFYFTGVIILIAIFCIGILRIKGLRKKYPTIQLHEINFINTDAKGTPFSFFNSIFWNKAIELNSISGQKIFNHEVAHIKEKHSYDKVFMNVVLIFFWINPFFWLIQKELAMIHEFIADKQALEDNDLNSFAEMILQTVYPGKQFPLTNNFFHSPIKRRLIMFTKNKNPKMTYLSRLLALPLVAVIFMAFTFKMKTIYNAAKYNGKIITVVIDAGHGGSDNGAVQGNIKEKDISLSIANEIKMLNKNKNLNIILSRQGDELKTPKERTAFAIEKKADLFVSIHIDAEYKAKVNTQNGVLVFIPKDDNAYLNNSKLLGSALLAAFKGNDHLKVDDNLTQRQQGIWVLNSNNCPSVLVETGFLSSPSDLDYLRNKENHKIIAQNILDGIEKYAEQNFQGTSNIKSSQMKTSQLGSEKKPFATLAGNATVYDSINGVTGKADTVLIESIDKSSTLNMRAEATGSINIEGAGNSKEPVYFIDGKEITKDQMQQIAPDKIQSIAVLKDGNAIAAYGEKAKNGIVIITMKSAKTSDTDTIPDKLFTKVENEAAFPGGHDAWIKYILSKMKATQAEFKNSDFGTCVLKFIVNTDGSISHVEATTMENSVLAKVAIEAVRTGPKWIPATQNGQVVASYRLQPVTLTNPN